MNDTLCVLIFLLVVCPIAGVVLGLLLSKIPSDGWWFH